MSAEFVEVTNTEAWHFQCPDYAGALAPDCQHFMAMPIHLTVGYENLIYGEAIPEMNGGKSGLSKANIQIR